MRDPERPERPPRSFVTRAVHAGEPRDRVHGGALPTVTPLHPSTTYHYEHADELDGVFAGTREGYVYGRYGSPTTEALERAVAELEGAAGAVSYASGMAAVHAALLAPALKEGAAPPRRVIIAENAYGATRALGAELLAPLGAEVTVVDSSDLDAVAAALPGARVLLVESISNPLLRVADVAALARLAHGAGAVLAVDATFATPYLWRPLEHGADLVVHSATKYLGGHGDATLGVLCAGGERAPELLSAARRVARIAGGTASPFDAFLVHRGLKTLPLRMARQCQSAQRLAERLAEHPTVARVIYPGLPGHPDHALCRRLSEGRGAGGVLTLELAHPGPATARALLDALELCLPATSLGDVQTLVLVPAMSSHRQVPSGERARLGITDQLVRISVGLEDPEDLLADLEQALTRISAAA